MTWQAAQAEGHRVRSRFAQDPQRQGHAPPDSFGVPWRRAWRSLIRSRTRRRLTTFEPSPPAVRVSRHAHRFFENVALHVGAALYHELEQMRREVRLPRQRPDLEHIVEAQAGRAAQRPLDCFLLRVDLDDVEAADQFLGFGERPVHHAALPFLRLDAGDVAARLQPFGSHEHAGLVHLLVELHVGAEQRLVERRVRIGGSGLSGPGRAVMMNRMFCSPLPSRRMRSHRIDIRRETTHPRAGAAV